jgi:hypothetical protein
MEFIKSLSDLILVVANHPFATIAVAVLFYLAAEIIRALKK